MKRVFQRRKEVGQSLKSQIRRHPVTAAVYFVLRIIVLGMLVVNILEKDYESAFICLLSLFLFLLPAFVEKRFCIDIPSLMEIVILLFIFAAEILGELRNYYGQYPHWDTMLHTLNGFMFAAFGFCLVDIFNKTKRFRFQLSPIFLAIVAFCFSMTIGVLWEFFEFGADVLLHTDMQKDTVVTAIHSVSLPNDLGQKVTHVADIISTTLVTAAGDVIVINGYLDIGIADTVKDMFVNFIGAVVFSTIGYFYVKHRGKGKLAEQFVPVFVGGEACLPRDDATEERWNEDEK